MYQFSVPSIVPFLVFLYVLVNNNTNSILTNDKGYCRLTRSRDGFGVRMCRPFGERHSGIKAIPVLVVLLTVIILFSGLITVLR